ncbi:hypothetical protein [Actinoplanes philippinensis]
MTRLRRTAPDTHDVTAQPDLPAPSPEPSGRLRRPVEAPATEESA